MARVEVYPVVHITTPEASAQQADVAFEAGADGVYLIDHRPHGSFGRLFETFNQVKSAHLDDFVGINPLAAGDALSSLRLLELARARGQLDYLPDGLWVDHANYGSRTSTYEELRAFRESHPELTGIKLLGGVAFKHTRDYTDEPEAAAAQAAEAAPYLDVITTSGERTGRAPSVAKIRAMKEGGGGRIAIASGVNAWNVGGYAPYADELLVGSSIETRPNSGIFDLNKLKRLIDAAHGRIRPTES